MLDCVQPRIRETETVERSIDPNQQHPRRNNHNTLQKPFTMSAKNIGGAHGKKPASAATNLIGTSIVHLYSRFLTQRHLLTKNHSWRGSRNDGSACMPPTWYVGFLVKCLVTLNAHNGLKILSKYECNFPGEHEHPEQRSGAL